MVFRLDMLSIMELTPMEFTVSPSIIMVSMVLPCCPRCPPCPHFAPCPCPPRSPCPSCCPSAPCPGCCPPWTKTSQLQLQLCFRWYVLSYSGNLTLVPLMQARDGFPMAIPKLLPKLLEMINTMVNPQLMLLNLPIPNFEIKLTVICLHQGWLIFCRAICISLTLFLKTISLFSRRFFHRILSVCMVSIWERFLIKSNLWWFAYGRLTTIKSKKNISYLASS